MSSLAKSKLRSLGAETGSNGVMFTAWGPERSTIRVHVQSGSSEPERILTLDKMEEGYFSGLDALGRAGDLYTLSVDGIARLPDLASRYQPYGITGPSMVIDPSVYHWKANWRRPAWQGQVIYELHVGTFTEEGTYTAALQHLDHLLELGITVIEVMPLAECTGTRNWGYDGVLLFAPYHPYGTPDELRTFVDGCHARGLAVMLDVVYNHIGAVGDCTDSYSKHLSHPDNSGAWGKSFNLHGRYSRPVRHFLLQNIAYWLDEFRIDGFRFDATQAIRDESEVHLLVEATELAHSRGAFVTAEDDRNTAEILKLRREGGWQLDAVWSDDFHHAMRVSQTREDHSYLGRYSGSLPELAEILRHGWYFRGQGHPKLKKPKGTSCEHLPPECFIDCISNHDQVGNRPFGDRLHQSISPEAYRAVSLFLCLIPYTPMLFMGQEWAASSPFLFFTDHPPDFGRLVMEGRARDFKFDVNQYNRPLPNCQDEAVFKESKLNWEKLHKPIHRKVLALYREGLSLRKRLFGSHNPARSQWSIETHPDHLSVTYRLPEGTFKVALWISAAMLDSSRVLLRSNEERFARSSRETAPETTVQRLS